MYGSALNIIYSVFWVDELCIVICQDPIGNVISISANDGDKERED
jgi:hypothetical protein